MFNPWCTLRLIGGTIVIVTYFSHQCLELIFLGLVIIAIGTVNGLHSLERRVEALEKERDDAKI